MLATQEWAGTHIHTPNEVPKGRGRRAAHCPLTARLHAAPRVLQTLLDEQRAVTHRHARHHGLLQLLSQPRVALQQHVSGSRVASGKQQGSKCRWQVQVASSA